MKHSRIVAVALISTGMILMACATRATAEQARNQMRERVLSKDFAVAKEALEENKKRKNVEMIRLSLNHYSLIIKRLATEALAELGDKGSVPSLIRALENNRVTLRGGTETQVLQSELDRAIVSALEKLTGLSFSKNSVLSGGDIKQIIERSNLWWNANKQRIKQ
jgi:HEAT repeat protein